MYILLTYRVNMFAYLNIILPKSGMTMTYWLATQEPYIVEYVQIRMTAHAIFFCMCTRYVICISRQRFPMILKKYKQYFSVLSPLHSITLSTILLFLGSITTDTSRCLTALLLTLCKILLTSDYKYKNEIYDLLLSYSWCFKSNGLCVFCK